MFTVIVTFVFGYVALLAGAGALHALPRMGDQGKEMVDFLSRAPALDFAVFYFNMLPPVAGFLLAGFYGLIGGVAAQFAALITWQWAHERAHRDAVQGPRIVTVLNNKFGRLQNHLALYVTTLATPVFWLTRFAQVVAYPPLTLLVRLPKYKSSEWINVSRHKFDGLVGHDRIWCLYCDWMTGVWSLGTEMLRNVESLWCPIRFSCPKKCANCSIDFPDLDGGWVAADGTMEDVVKVLDDHYTSEPEPQPWFGHPSRKSAEPAGESTPPPAGP